jgi:ABC-type dipeptide/oligopeptide/nickel transport system ATPase component
VPSGCAFHPRCDDARLEEPCATQKPDLRSIADLHLSACHFAEELPQLSTSDLAAEP